MGLVDGAVALITGAARGQGRAHALRLALEGADVIVTDVEATQSHLDEVVGEIESLGRRALAGTADVREFEQLNAVVDAGLETFGRIDVVCANAGVLNGGATWEITEDQWDQVVDVNLKGVWHTCKATIPSMIAAKRGGSIILIGSVAAVRGLVNLGPYVASKHGVVGLMKTLANELGPHMIRVNVVHPTAVDTPMLNDVGAYKRGLLSIEGSEPNPDDFLRARTMRHTIPVPSVDPEDISNAVLWLASDESRYVTGIELPVDAGLIQKT